MSSTKPHSSSSRGGQSGIRGYVVQTLAALLDVTLNEGFLAVTLEPTHSSEKFDFLWQDHAGNHAVQVKSTDGQFSAADIRRWASELESSGSATNYTLTLVGLLPRSFARTTKVGNVQIKRKNLDLPALREQGAHRLDHFLVKQRLPSGTPHYREMVVDALSARLMALSASGSPLPRAEFIAQLLTWINSEELPSPRGRIEVLLRKCRERLASQTSGSHILLKYDNRYYVRRTLEDEIEKWLTLPHSKRSSCFLLLSPAGCGKTNILCNIATRSSEARPTFLLTGGQLRLDERLGIWGMLGELLEDEGPKNMDRKSVIEELRRIVSTHKAGVIVVLDAINEYHEPAKLRRELSLFLAEAKSAEIATLISCRDYYWGLFEGEFWNEFIRAADVKAKPNKRVLGNFSGDEAAQAFDKYFTVFDIKVRPEGNAREQFRHPLLLRFFCETHRGRRIGTLQDVRLKELFDKYWTAKLTSVAERMIEQGQIGIAEELKNHVSRGLLDIAGRMLQQNTRAIQLETVLELTNSAQVASRLQTPYGRILDEHIILEELALPGARPLILVAFVFEEFMEYAMARFLVCEWLTLSESEIAQAITTITKKYSDFSQVFGVILYTGLMLKSDRGVALWPTLIGMGATWEEVVIEAFKKLSADQIDDTVFEAITDLLRLPRKEIQIKALELLKFRRLKRILPKELIAAVGDLAVHDDRRIRRRALKALEVCPADLAIPHIDRAISTRMHRLTDQYVVVENALTALSAFNTADSLRVRAKIAAGYKKSRASELPPECWVIVNELLETETDPFVQIGLIEIMGASSWKNAAPVLEKLASASDPSPRETWNATVPAWVSRFDYEARCGTFNGFKQYGEYRLKIDFRNQLSVIQYFARLALANLVKTLAKVAGHQRWVDMIEIALSEEKVSGSVPVPIDLWMEAESYYEFQNSQLVSRIIKRGLELRSGKVWSVDGPFNHLIIKSPRKRLINGNMTPHDLLELRELLGLSESAAERNMERGIEIYVSSWQHNYWKEYIYRAWGEPPKVLGYWDRPD